MATLGEILRRFRFHGVPGAPVTFAVPANRSAELDAELQPVLALLDDDQKRVEDLLARAKRDADRRRASAIEQASRIVADARALQDSTRAEAATEVLTRAALERAALLAAAEREVDRVERAAAERTPALVDDVVRRVLALGALNR